MCGYTVEAALSGEDWHGDVRLTVHEPKPGKFPGAPPQGPATGPLKFDRPAMGKTGQAEMGFGAGGGMKQKLYPDPYGIDV